MLSDEQVMARGWSVPIYRAIEAAGGPVAVAQALGLKTAQMPAYQWARRRNIPAQYIVRLCDMGGRKVQPEDILSDIS
jgi:hypothetical protein